ncbi:hypothetical protein GCM10010468_28990 [Actinocorallia longicatena]|uniref:DUF202 domain-containing protein n=1 Tax=Actinocorallia longicatena TaxID=111803 RepID=A0ABP6QAX8_9ACTN
MERTSMAWSRTLLCYLAAMLGLSRHLFGTRTMLAAAGVLVAVLVVLRAGGTPRPGRGVMIALTAATSSACAAFFLFGLVLR